MLLIASATAAFGVLFNSGGTIGLIPVIAATAYCVTTYLARDILLLKSVVAVNLLIWVGYSFLIYDFAAVAINAVAAVLSIASIMRYKKEENKNRRDTLGVEKRTDKK